MSRDGDRDRSVSSVLDPVPHKSVSIGLRCGGVGGGPCIGLSGVVSGFIEHLQL